MQVDWGQFGLAGLFALFAVILLRSFLQYLKDERGAVLANQARIIDVLNKIETNLANVNTALINHDARVSGVMEIMQEASGINLSDAFKSAHGRQQQNLQSQVRGSGK